MKKILFLTALLGILQLKAQTVVFSQTSSGTTGIISDAIANGSFVASADDFTLTNQTTITKVKVEGFQNAGTLAAIEATGLMMYIYADNAGKPAGIPNNPAVAPIAQIDIAKGAPGYSLVKSGTYNFTFSVDVTAALSSPLVLQPGTVYWLVFIAKTNLSDFTSSASTRFNWFAGQANGNMAKLVDPGNAFGVGATSWSTISTLTNQPAYNGLAFSIEGNNAVLGTTEVFSNIKEIAVSPNPTLDYLFIKAKSKVNKIEVFDVAGRKMNVSSNEERVDVRGLQTGNYIIKVETKEGITSQKFIKK